MGFLPWVEANPWQKSFENQLDWRSRRDSNTRYALRAYNSLANRRLQPLGHSSVTGGYARATKAWQASPKEARCARQPPAAARPWGKTRPAVPDAASTTRGQPAAPCRFRRRSFQRRFRGAAAP